MTKRLLLFIALMCAFAQGAWAQTEWDIVYAMTQTTSANWTPINAGSTDGYVLGASNTTTYYYVDGNQSFINNKTDNLGNGNSGIKIQGTVYLFIPSGTTLTCRGANASGITGAGAGVELSSGNTLHLLGGGRLNANGGDAANGGNGGDGDDANYKYNKYCQPGSGGRGGDGGGGAGAGIGTRGTIGQRPAHPHSVRCRICGQAQTQKLLVQILKWY